MSDANDLHHQTIIEEFVDDAIRPHTYPVGVVASPQFAATDRPRILRQSPNGLDDPGDDWRVQPTEFTPG